MKRFFFIGSIIIFCVLCRCSPDESSVCAPPETVSFSKDIVPIFNQYCVSCHSGTSPSANLNLEQSAAYAQLTKAGKGYIDTLTPAYSVLYASINSSANPMPPTGKLDKCQLDIVLKWITQKAKNN